MSIFKGTINPSVAWQLSARKKVIQQEKRDSLFMSYTTAKNGWTRLSSFVDADIPQRNSKGKEIKGTFRYTGDQLARKYVLEGGTLYEKNNSSFLRGGVGRDGAAYGSDLDKLFSQYQSGTATFSGQKNIDVQNIYSDRPFGVRPMPGISSVAINNKSAYGSLREATIKYYCWDKHQLEELELLYMRVGYSVLLEWGWSQYLDYNTSNLPSSNLNDINFDKLNVPIESKTFPSTGFIDAFQKTYSSAGGGTLNVSDSVIYQVIDNKIESNRCNYDAMLGIIKNFSWQLLPNGGYECTTILISRGEVISSLRLTNNGDPKTNDNLSANAANNEPPLTKFEKIFYNLQAYINSKEIKENVGSFYVPPPGPPPPPTTPPTPPPAPVPGFKSTQVIEQTAAIVANKLKAALADSKNLNIFRDSQKKQYKPVISKDNFITDEIGVTTYINGSSTEGTGNEYISLNLLIYILNIFFTLKDESVSQNGTGLDYFVRLVLPQGTPCLASTNSVSVDPTTCLVKNPKALLITGNPTNTTGYTPHLYYADGSNVDPAHIQDFLMSDGRGDIGAILVSIDKLTTLYKESNSGSDGVIMIEYIQTLLNDISAALGGINDFKIFIDKDRASIFDAKYLEDNSATAVNGKYKLDLFGLKSICRDVKITSRIFEEQSTMIAIGAQNQGNIGDIYSSTYNYLNNGLKDRLHKTKDLTQADIQALAVSLFPDLRTLYSYIQNKCLGDINNDPTRTKNYVLAVNPEEIPTANSIYKTFQLRIGGEDIDYKDLIPFELELTLDGIAGFIQGQIFRIDNTILPRDYINKKVGLIITGISHNLQNNDWTTTLKTQICLLDQESLKDSNPNKGLQKKLTDQLAELIKLDKKNNILWSAYADYLTYLTVATFKFVMGDNPAIVTKGDYVITTNGQLGKLQADLQNFSQDGAINIFLAGDPNNSHNTRPKHYYFNTYYEKIWYPNAMSASAIPADIKSEIPTPAEYNSGGKTYKYKYIDNSGNIADGTLYVDLDLIVVNGGSGPVPAELIGRPNANYEDVIKPWDPNPSGTFPIENVRPSFLTRRNTGRFLFKDFAGDVSNDYVGIPLTYSGNYVNFKIINHPYVKFNTTSNSYSFDTGAILGNGNKFYADVTMIHRTSQTFLKNLGSIRDTTNSTFLPPAINPINTRFLDYSVEAERCKSIFIDPDYNPGGDKSIAIIKQPAS